MEISWRVRRRKRRKKVTSRSTEELVLKNDFGQSFIVIVEKYDITLIVLFQKATINEN